jgi:hypothetical protein
MPNAIEIKKMHNKLKEPLLLENVNRKIKMGLNILK